jgi:hypothetical protein
VSLGLAVLLAGAAHVWPPPADRLAETAWLATMIGGFTAAYVACHAAHGAEEVWVAWTTLIRRRRRSA